MHHIDLPFTTAALCRYGCWYAVWSRLSGRFRGPEISGKLTNVIWSPDVRGSVKRSAQSYSVSERGQKFLAHRMAASVNQKQTTRTRSMHSSGTFLTMTLKRGPGRCLVALQLVRCHTRSRCEWASCEQTAPPLLSCETLNSPPHDG